MFQSRLGSVSLCGMQSMSADKTCIHFSTCLFIVPHNNLTDSPSAFSFSFLQEFLNAPCQALTATSLSGAPQIPYDMWRRKGLRVGGFPSAAPTLALLRSPIHVSDPLQKPKRGKNQTSKHELLG